MMHLKVLSVLALLLVCSFAVADLPNQPTTYTATWVAPTTRANGDLLSASEIAGYEFSSSCEEGLISVENSLSITRPIVLPMSCQLSVRTVDTNGIRSEFSNQVQYTINQPNDPTITDVSVNNIGE